MHIENKKERSFIRLKDRFFIVFFRKYYRAWRREINYRKDNSIPFGVWLYLINTFIIKKTKYFTPANFLSLMRGLLAYPLYQLLDSGYFVSALGVYTVGLLTDYFDGHFARSFSQETDIGKISDPFFDKVFNFVALLFVYNNGLVPAWLFFSVLGLDMVLLLSVPVLKLAPKILSISRPLGSNNYGKWKFFFQCAGFLGFIASAMVAANGIWQIIFLITGYILLITAILFAIASIIEHSLPGLLKKIAQQLHLSSQMS